MILQHTAVGQWMTTIPQINTKDKPNIFHPAPSPFGIPYRCLYSVNIENLYFAGEVVDVDGLTGGFNLQIAFSTGFLAGTSVFN